MRSCPDTGAGHAHQRSISRCLFFYKPAKGNGNGEPLFRALMQHINATYSTKEGGLRQFMDKDLLLVDATYAPVNSIEDADERAKVILADYPALVADLLDLTPDRSAEIILIKHNVCELLESRLLKDGFRVINRKIKVPFPYASADPFCKKLDEILAR